MHLESSVPTGPIPARFCAMNCGFPFFSSVDKYSTFQQQLQQPGSIARDTSRTAKVASTACPSQLSGETIWPISDSWYEAFVAVADNL